MGFDVKSRRGLVRAYRENWEKKNRLVLALLSKKEKQLVEEMLTGRGGEPLQEIVRENTDVKSLSALIKKKYKKIADAFVPKEFRKDFYAILDKCNQFQYARSIYRRSVRTENYGMHVEDAFMLMKGYYSFGIYGCGIGEISRFLRDEMSEELINLKYNSMYPSLIDEKFDEIFAARIDAGDVSVIQTIKDMFLSENNTSVVTKQVIRAVVKSSNAELHELLGRFLLAARLSEGVRQVICENADCGTTEAFLAILDVIKENNLVRFAAVKRAIATWTGICNEENMDRITNKVLDDILFVLKDRKQAKAYIQSEDAVHIVIGLWSMGFYEVEDAIAEMQNILAGGSRVQLLAMSYYNLSFENPALSREMALAVIEKYPENLELVAAYMPTYMAAAEDYIFELYKAIVDKKKKKYVPIEYLFESGEQAEKHFYILKNIYERMNKKKMEYRPLVFPWYGVVLSKHDLLSRMSLIADMLDDNEMRDYVCTRFEDLDSNYDARKRNIVLHLRKPKTEIQRKALIEYTASKDMGSRSAALNLLKELITQKEITLTEDEYQKIESFLRFKNEGIRENAITLLNLREDKGLKTSIERLLASDTSLIRLAGLDLIRSREQKTNDKFAESLIEKIREIKEPTGEEQILIEEICGQGGADAILNQKGYGLYNPDTVVPAISLQADVSVCRDFFHVSAKQITKLFEQLYAFIDAHAELEYTDVSGEERLLGNVTRYGWWLYTISNDNSLKLYEKYPFPELWKEFYDTYVKTPETLMCMYMAYCGEMDEKQLKPSVWIHYEKKLYGDINSEYKIPSSKYLDSFYHANGIRSIILCMMSMYDISIPREVAKQAVAYAAFEMPEKAMWCDYENNSINGWYQEYEGTLFTNSSRFLEFISVLRKWKTEEEFRETFLLLYYLDKKNAIWDKPKKKRHGYNFSIRLQNQNYLDMYYYVKAYMMGIIDEDMVYKAAFEMLGIRSAVIELGVFMKEKLYPYEKSDIEQFLEAEESDSKNSPAEKKQTESKNSPSGKNETNGKTSSAEKDEIDRESDFWKTGVKVYKKIIDTILNVELKRGDSETIFSKTAMAIKKIYGMDRLTAILKALGTSTLSRGGYGSGTGKKEILSHLLAVCEPIAGDTGEKLRTAAKENKISEERLIEVAMYAPQWIDIIEECLGYSGLKSGCYYFMAHMDENFDDRRAAMIAKYTPLSKEELNEGCFDVKWFYEAYETLGEKLFNKLYNSAKYISYGSKHSRARKYADAALGRVTVSELEAAIRDKRNKDLLMSYGIIPVTGTEDILHRYEFLQNFKKESRQFGAQRRASEATAVSCALKNLATTAGYSDETRLILAMEAELVKSSMQYLEGIDIEEYRIKIEVDEIGKVSMSYEKAGKKLKSVPAALKKNEQYLEIKAFHDKLKAQYSRTVAMLETSMEDRDVYTFGELIMLCENPVTKHIVENLVYITVDDKIGMITDGSYMDAAGNAIAVDKDTKIRIAHPFDLYYQEVWTGYQKLFFDRNREQGRKQPFKQVFRELYVKLPEELDKESSLMFAGNQIQPKKTVACLKGRRWIADYEAGLQKVYYKDDIIACIYAVADWFSPADVEEPVLECVTFSNRKTYQPIKICDVPDIIYSEVMRDVDLAVSVAHAGGVDPETSHSTVEMRRVILAFNLELFGIHNVRFEKNHALIDGKRGSYSVHLGSGVVHKLGGHQINVVALQGSKHSKIFLPFIDEDPKTAEIMSKVLLFAEDDKIKDPYIMEQIMRGGSK